MSNETNVRTKKTICGALILAGVQVGGALILTLPSKVFGWIDVPAGSCRNSSPISAES